MWYQEIHALKQEMYKSEANEILRFRQMNGKEFLTITTMDQGGEEVCINNNNIICILTIGVIHFRHYL